MLKTLFKGAMFKKLLAFGSRHKVLGLGGLLGYLGYRNRHRLMGRTNQVASP